MNKNTPLSCKLVAGKELVIRIGVATLAYAFEHSDDNNPWDGDAADFKKLHKITDFKKFAAEVSRALNDEGEDGSTMLTALFDRASQEALEQGAEGVREINELHTK